MSNNLNVNNQIEKLTHEQIIAAQEDVLRISKSGCSLKVGVTDSRIVASLPHNDMNNCNDLWLDDAQRICDGWNSAVKLESLQKNIHAKDFELIQLRALYVDLIKQAYALDSEIEYDGEYTFKWASIAIDFAKDEIDKLKADNTRLIDLLEECKSELIYER